MTELSDEALCMEEAETGMKAISLLEVNEYDVLLLDLNLPGLNGIEVMKKVKASEIPQGGMGFLQRTIPSFFEKALSDRIETNHSLASLDLKLGWIEENMPETFRAICPIDQAICPSMKSVVT